MIFSSACAGLELGAPATCCTRIKVPFTFAASLPAPAAASPRVAWLCPQPARAAASASRQTRDHFTCGITPPLVRPGQPGTRLKPQLERIAEPAARDPGGGR